MRADHPPDTRRRTANHRRTISRPTKTTSSLPAAARKSPSSSRVTRRNEADCPRKTEQIPAKTRSFRQSECEISGLAVCLLPGGTELAFDGEVASDATFRFLPDRKYAHKVARFRQVNLNNPAVHHDALEFPGGEMVLVTNLSEGQYATVLQLPAAARSTPLVQVAPAVLPQRIPAADW